MICIRISHTAAATPIVVADAPTFDQGETDEKPSPVPSANRMSDNAAATNAPPITAAQDTPDECASLLIEGSGRPFWYRVAVGEGSSCSMLFSTFPIIDTHLSK